MINATLVVGKVLQQLKRKVTAWHDGILLPARILVGSVFWTRGGYKAQFKQAGNIRKCDCYLGSSAIMTATISSWAQRKNENVMQTL